MTGEVIKSFLVGLGFGVDDTSLSKFNKAITSATVKVTALYAATAAAATGIVAGIAEVSEGFEQMGYEYRLIIPAVNKAIALRREMLKAYSAAGINIQKVVQSAVKLNFSLAKTKFAFEAIYKSVASRFFGVLTKQSDLFRQKIYANMPRIQAALERFVNFVFKALDATTQLGLRVWSILTRVFDFFVKLHEATGGWSTIILGVVAAWKLLNLSFLATPLGLVLSGLLAILALYDDFQVWKEGGKSFFDWTSFVPVIDSVATALKSVYAVLEAIGEAIASVIVAMYQLFTGDFAGAWRSLGEAGNEIVQVFERLWDVIKGVGGSLASLGTWASGLNVLSGLFSGGGGAPQAAPLGVNAGASNPQTNQHVQQQTTINVTGSADANATGRAVSSEQTRVNFDMVRNMKGATR
jgi:hypothetical protein